MPIYEFQCRACGKEFEELFRSTGAVKPPACPKCRSRKTAAAVLRLRHEQRFGRQVRGVIRRLVRRMPAVELRGMRTLTRLPIADWRLPNAD